MNFFDVLLFLYVVSVMIFSLGYTCLFVEFSDWCKIHGIKQKRKLSEIPALICHILIAFIPALRILWLYSLIKTIDERKEELKEYATPS